MKKLLACGAAIAALVATTAAHAALPNVGPTIGSNSSANLIITLSGSGATIGDHGFGPYDGVEDTYLGVVNNSGGTVNFLDLVGSNIFGFDGDGLCTYVSAACSTYDPNGLNGGYAGGGSLGSVQTFFSNITDSDHGRVNFKGGLADGGTAFFSLEETLSTTSFKVTTVGGGAVPEPATWAILLVGFFGMGSLLRHRRASAVAA